MLNQRLTLVLVLIPSFISFSQEKSPAKFGNVSPKDFETKIYPVDSNAHAVVIADIGHSSIEGNTKNWFSLNFKHYKRVHILNKNGYDIANVSIHLYSNGTDEAKLEKLKAVTYNLENGKVVESKLDVKSAVYKDKYDKNFIIKKFTFPNVKEGSIIEFEYTIISDFLRFLQPWEFQGEYPRLWSEYNLMLPFFFNYVFLTQGYLRYDINDRQSGNTVYDVTLSQDAGPSERISLKSNYTDYRWVIKNVPALKEEGFTSTTKNHIQKIEFQLSEYRQPLTPRTIMTSWPETAKDLMESEAFGQALYKENSWLNELTKPLVKDLTDKKEKARKIFEWVRDNFTCTDHNDFFMNQQLKNVVKSRNGTVAEINLLLTAMLIHENIEAKPVILSTRSNGYTHPIYPLLTRFNYVISLVTIDGKKYYLDASEPRIGFGYLSPRCYNGHCRILEKNNAVAMDLLPDDISENKTTSLFIINDEKGDLVGSVNQTPGYYESLELRNRIKEKGKEELVKGIQKDFGVTIDISNFGIDSLEKYDNPVGIHYDFDIKEEKEDIMYLNPMFGEGFKENPFKSAQRFYPVEMPYTFDETYTLSMEVPQGYVADELPKSLIVKINEESEGLFDYRITQSGNNISLRSRLVFKRATFTPEEYELLREFFNLIVNKHNEQIVFKKKK